MLGIPITLALESAARSYPRRLPLTLVTGRGVMVRDSKGNDYIDCLAGAGALALGHNHPVVVSAIERSLRDEVPLTTLDLATPLRDAFVEELFSVLPPHLRQGRIHFCAPSGADAVEAACKLAKTATGRTGVIAFGGAYHGMTQATLALSGVQAPKLTLGPLLADVHHLPFGSSEVLDWALADPQSGITPPAAVIAEPVQGEGGVNPMQPAFARSLRRATQANGALLVADEVQTGLGRTGALWASQPLELEPDILVLSKAIGGGLPLAVIVYRAELDVWQPGAHTGTFRGNQLALAAGATTIRHIVDEGLAEHARQLGGRFRHDLATMCDGNEQVVEVRGRGLMVGVELIDGASSQRIQQEMLRRGVIVELGGRDDSVVRFLPPLILEPHHVDQIVEAFGKSLWNDK